MKDWQFTVLFLVGVGGAIFLLLAPDLGFEKASNPTATAGIGAILAFVLTQKDKITKTKSKKDEREEEDDGE